MWKHFFTSFGRTWKFNPAMQLATFSVLVGTFCVITIFVSVHQNLNQLLTRWGEDVQMTVFLKEEVVQGEVSKVETFLKNITDIEHISYISKDEAARRFQKQMGAAAPDLLSDKDFGNPLPASFEVKLGAHMATAAAFETLVNLADKVSSLESVDEVSYGQGWVENYSSLVNQFGKSSWLLVIILLAGSLLVIGNSIRNSIFQRRDEIEVLELVGATARRIQGPFIFEGAVIGGLSALIALFICYVFFQWQVGIFDEDLKFLGLAGQLTYLQWSHFFGIPLLGTVFGGLGAYICVRKVSSGWSAAERLETWAE